MDTLHKANVDQHLVSTFLLLEVARIRSSKLHPISRYKSMFQFREIQEAKMKLASLPKKTKSVKLYTT